MTQVKRAQELRGQLARYERQEIRSLAEKRAVFATQMRDMALADKQAVARRLRELKAELERSGAREIADYDLASEIGVKYRTYQSWVNAEVENRDGKGYDKIAAYYSRKLGREITRGWILFGDAGQAQDPDEKSEPAQGMTLADLAAAVEALREQVQELAASQAELAAGRARGARSSAGSKSTSKRVAPRRKATRS